jgi:hypothetical protein
MKRKRKKQKYTVQKLCGYDREWKTSKLEGAEECDNKTSLASTSIFEIRYKCLPLSTIVVNFVQLNPDEKNPPIAGASTKTENKSSLICYGMNIHFSIYIFVHLIEHQIYCVNEELG